jgi:hypothetical protein
VKTVQYDDNCMSQRKDYEWVKIFKGGRTSAEDACMEVKEQIDQSTWDNNKKSVSRKLCLKFGLVMEE